MISALNREEHHLGDKIFVLSPLSYETLYLGYWTVLPLVTVNKALKLHVLTVRESDRVQLSDR